MSESYTQKAKQIISENLYLTISVTTLTGDPWIANLFFACDQNYNFFWYSGVNSTHSQTIRENREVAISIFNSTKVGEKVDAVYIKASAFEISEKEELKDALSVYSQKLLETSFLSLQEEKVDFESKYNDFLPESGLRFYKACPKKIWKLGPTKTFNEKYLDQKIEIDL
jgi:uncharacterized protein YhbP (UPF0306 family)